MPRDLRLGFILATVLGFSLGADAQALDEPITFIDIASDSARGLDYRRQPNPELVAMHEQIRETVPFTLFDFPTMPFMRNGAPGVALFDYDNDGDLDIYVTNGAGTPNSLFSSQLIETGVLNFVDVAAASGTEVTDGDGWGTCYGDIDNDGDEDLFVQNSQSPSVLLENNGDGTFADITDASGLSSPDVLAGTGCSMGDLNNDGWLDILESNSFDPSNSFPLFGFPPTESNHPSRIFVNTGNNQFVDASSTSEISDFKGVTWACMLVDRDLDGDVDAFLADDQGPLDAAEVARGYIRVYDNDGTGLLLDRTAETGMTAADRIGGWMGLSAADFDQDGTLDIFGSDFSGYTDSQGLVPGTDPGALLNRSSRVFFGNATTDGFDFRGLEPEEATPFGWGTSVLDYDLDGDTDIIFHGATDLLNILDMSNPGALLQNDGSGRFVADRQAFATDHRARSVFGVAVGDLNGDGADDIVTAAASVVPPGTPTKPYDIEFGSPFDDAVYVDMMDWECRLSAPGFPPACFSWQGNDVQPGTLSVEINSASNDHHSVAVTLNGMKGTNIRWPGESQRLRGHDSRYASRRANGDGPGSGRLEQRLPRQSNQDLRYGYRPSSHRRCALARWYLESTVRRKEGDRPRVSRDSVRLPGRLAELRHLSRLCTRRDFRAAVRWRAQSQVGGQVPTERDPGFHRLSLRLAQDPGSDELDDSARLACETDMPKDWMVIPVACPALSSSKRP